MIEPEHHRSIEEYIRLVTSYVIFLFANVHKAGHQRYSQYVRVYMIRQL